MATTLSSRGPRFDGPGLGAFDASPGGPIYLARLLVYWSGPEIYRADSENQGIYFVDFKFCFPGCDCTGDGRCCTTSNNSSRGAERRAPPKAGLLLLRWWWVRQLPGVDSRLRKRQKMRFLGSAWVGGSRAPPPGPEKIDFDFEIVVFSRPVP